MTVIEERLTLLFNYLTILEELKNSLNSIDELKSIASEIFEFVKKLDLDPPSYEQQLRNIIDTVVKVLKPNLKVKLAYVFGSQVVERASERSDVDIVVYVDGDLSWREYIALMNDLEDALSKSVDLVVLNDAPLPLAYQIVAFGKPILIRDRNFMADFETRILREYLDFEPKLRLYRKAILKKLKKSH